MFTLIVIALTVGLLPGFAWLIFYLSEETHPEPGRMIALTFFAGIAFGFFAIVVEEAWTRAAQGAGIAALSLGSLAVLAAIEEVLKFAAAYFAVGKSSVIRKDPVDHMIYLIVAALGFTTLENIGTIANLPLASSGLALAAAAFQMGSVRFVGATLLHTLTSAIVGYHWAKGVARGTVVRSVLWGLALATFLHAAFNSLILDYGEIAYTAVFLLAVGFFVLNDFEKLRYPNGTTG